MWIQEGARTIAALACALAAIMLPPAKQTSGAMTRIGMANRAPETALTSTSIFYQHHYGCMANRASETELPDAKQDVEAQAERLAKPLTDNQVIAGLSIGIIDGDKTYVFNYGTVSTDRPAKPDVDTIYEIGSVSKVFTGTLLAVAIERKQVRLEDPIQKYLPASVTVPEYEKTPITLLDLATQHSGLPRLPGNFAPKDPHNPYADYDEKSLYAFLSGYKLARKPGEKYEYSNLGMGLLGFALARHAGVSYETLLKTRILDPLGMKHTLITLTPDARKHLARGHNADGDPEANWDLGVLQGAGGIRSSVHDMLLFLKANVAEAPAGLREAIALAQKRAAPIESSGGIALAWHILPDGKTIWHNGGTGGYSSMLAFDREKRRGVVVLCNTSNEIVTTLGFDLLKILAGETPEPFKFRKAAHIDQSVLDRYIGEYEIAPGTKMTVTHEGERMLAQLTGQGKATIYPSSETEFFWRIVDAQVTFVRDAQGKTTGLVLHQNGQNVPAKKIK